MKLCTFHITVALVEGHMVVALNAREVRSPSHLWQLLKDSALPLPEVKLTEPLDVSTLVREYAERGGTITTLRGVGREPLPVHSAPKGLTLDDLEIY